MKRKMIGDVDFEAVKEKTEAITPVPGGVEPMLVTMLLVNTVIAAQRQAAEKLKDSSQTLVLFLSSL